MSTHDKHRQRLDERVNKYGFEMLQAHEQLEHLLFAVIPRGDTNGIAHRLLRRFGSIAGVLNADYEELICIEGVGNRTAMFLNTLPQLLGVVERSVTYAAPPKLDTFEAISDFVKSYFYGKLVEEVYVISLNSSYRLLAISKISDGSPDEAGAVPYAVVKQAIRDNASVAIVAHNHPCGSLNASLEDVTLSAKLYKAFESVGIVLHDSVIVAGGQCLSIAHQYTFERLNKLNEVKE